MTVHKKTLSGTSLQASKKLVVIRMRPDPVPRDRVTLAQAKCAPVTADSRRVDRAGCMHLLEIDRAVRRIGAPQAKGSLGLKLDFGRKCFVTAPEARCRDRFHFGGGNSSGVTCPAC